MSTDKPKSPPPARSSTPLADLPAQPVDETEAAGVKGGTPSETGSIPSGIAPSA